MKVHASVTKSSLIGGLLISALFAPLPVFSAEGGENDAAQSQEHQEQLRAGHEEMFAALEKLRQEAERAAEEARAKAEQLRAETERLRADSEETRHQAEAYRAEKMREFERARRELGRTHHELRRASQQVARAHRDLALAGDRSLRTRLINLGDRAMIGVVLGATNDEGIEIIGLSPDGPAERAGLQTGDVLVALRGESLTAAQGRSPRDVIYDVLGEVGEGEEITVTVLRDGERRDYMVKPEKREPASWASYIRLPEPPAVASPRAMKVPARPPHVLVERIALPAVDGAALAAEAEAMAEAMESYRAAIESGEDQPRGYAPELDFEDFGALEFSFDEEALSDIGTMALSEASVWFAGPAMRGIRFAELNEGLGHYFNTDRGVLVLDAPQDNAFGLEAGDVVLKIGDSEVGETSDIIRALRNYEPGDTVKLAIKRKQADRALEAEMPENRFSLIQEMMRKHRTVMEPEITVE